MFCTNCGYNNSDDAVFCEGCGMKLIRPMSYTDSESGSSRNPDYNGYDQNPNSSGYDQNPDYNGYDQNPDYSGYNQNPNQNEYGQNSGYNEYNQDSGYNDYSRDSAPEDSFEWETEEDEDARWEAEQRQRMARRESRQREQQKAESRRVIVTGIIVAAIIAVAGIGAFFGIRYFMNKDETAGGSTPQQISGSLQDQVDAHPSTDIDNQNGNNDPGQSPQVTLLPTQTVTPVPEASPVPSDSPIPTAEPTPEPASSGSVTVKVDKAASVNRSGYEKVGIRDAEASSTIIQDGYDNSVKMTYDGNEKTSWQDGIDGEGVGEFLHYYLDKPYSIRYLTFKMGNWRDQTNYDYNSRPKDITIWIGDRSFKATIPDGKTEYCVELSQDVTASEVYVRIDSVYPGTEWDDTCISEIGIYGK